jgi:dsDNA-specific endonuclease/ATPase MutS2
VDDAGWPAGRVTALRAADGIAPDAPRRLEPGRLGVVVVVDGMPIGDLPAGARLRLGPMAVVEIADPAAPGDLASVRDQAGGLLEESAGTLVPAEVLEPGDVTRGDDVALVAVAVPLTDVLDLHSFRPDETQRMVAAYLGDAQRAGLEEVRIVHGRGRGVQRALVRRVLSDAPEVAGFADAPPARGGWGATLVRLRRAEGSPSR